MKAPKDCTDFTELKDIFKMTDNEVSYVIRGAIYKVYNALGPGLLESVYEAALCYQLRKEGLRVENGSSEIWSDGYNKGVSRMDTSMRNPLQA